LHFTSFSFSTSQKVCILLPKFIIYLL
jgi:hypothetical protein